MWQKKGLIFEVKNQQDKNIISHASIPYCLHLKENRFRIFFSSRNKQGQSIPYSIDANIQDGQISLLGNVSKPLLDLGELGTFDDSGIMPSCLIRHKEKLLMYYIGWNPQVTVSYRLSIGLAVSTDEGKSFHRYSNGPICDRAINEPFFNTAPFILFENGIWKMWYISCTEWKIINDYPEPKYHVKYAESVDGINWEKNGVVCIDYDEKAEAIGRPCVIKKDKKYVMYFSYRKIEDYRTVRGAGYQIGMALSEDGKKWKKKYENIGIKLSSNGWDSDMMEYCHVFEHNNIFYMLYNGNNFGKQGFGYASKK